jgi:hypothetical protein
MTDSDAERSTTAVAEAVADALKRSGSISHPFSSDAERETLRRAGRRAGRMLNRPVHTTVIADRVHIAVTDWGDNPLEAQLKRTPRKQDHRRRPSRRGRQPAQPPAAPPIEPPRAFRTAAPLRLGRLERKTVVAESQELLS